VEYYQYFVNFKMALVFLAGRLPNNYNGVACGMRNGVVDRVERRRGTLKHINENKFRSLSAVVFNSPTARTTNT
jgi:hypothetical protein